MIVKVNKTAYINTDHLVSMDELEDTFVLHMDTGANIYVDPERKHEVFHSLGKVNKASERIAYGSF